MIRYSAFAALLALLPLTAEHALAQSKAEIAAGKKLATTNCAPCHAIGKSGTSKAKAAPPFRTLHNRYDLDELQEALAEGISVGHKGVQMPEFQFTPDQSDALIAYIKSLKK